MSEEIKPRGWISVGERLPDGDEFVLTYAGGLILACRIYTPDKGFDGWAQCETEGLNVQDITHWMPIPKLPEQEVRELIKELKASREREAETMQDCVDIQKAIYEAFQGRGIEVDGGGSDAGPVELSKSELEQGLEQIERRTKEALREYIEEHCEPKIEYGPHGAECWYYSRRDIFDAIDNCKVGGD